MAVHNPELMKPGIKVAFEAFLLAWGYKLDDLSGDEIPMFMLGYYRDQLLTLELTRRGQKIVLPPGRMN
jgi:hypothetical protein